MDLLISRQFLYMTNKFIKEFNIKSSEIDYIGLSGQTIIHKPDDKISIQLGSGKFLSQHLKINIVSNFRENDILNGGQGAPLAPIYHQVILAKIKPKTPSAVINIGGISNITYIDNDWREGTRPGGVRGSGSPPRVEPARHFLKYILVNYNVFL